MASKMGSQVDKYPAKSHARRVADEMSITKGMILIDGAKSQNWTDSDMPRPFRQDRYFYYLTGCNEPNCYVTYKIHFDELTLWLPPIDKARVVWTGRGSTVEEAMDKYDIDVARYHSNQRILDCEGVVGGEMDQDVYTVRPQSWSRAQGIRVQAGWLHAAMDACRVIKDEHEIESIKRASKISADAHTAVLKRIHTFSNEAEIEAEYMRVCIAAHAKEQAYAPIAGSGANGAELHYGKNDEDFGDSQLVVLDAGCEVNCYASDVTRTFPLNRKLPGHWPSKEAQDIYSLVEKIQEVCIALMQPGNSFPDIFQLSRRMAAEGLLEMGILTGSLDEITKAGTVSGFYPHGLGHHMGLEVHDVSPATHPPATIDAQYASLDPKLLHAPCVQGGQVLSPGMIVTVEPGIYFNKFLLDNFYLNNPNHAGFINKKVLDRYMQVGGVRIEDDILITKKGYKNLTTAPKGTQMLEVIRKAAATAGSP